MYDRYLLVIALFVAIIIDLKLRLADPRITRCERLKVEVEMADQDTRSYLTLADHEDDRPLALNFVPQGNAFAIFVTLGGQFNGWRLSVIQNESKRYHLALSETSDSLFTLLNSKTKNANYHDLNDGASYVRLVSERVGRGLFEGKGIYLRRAEGKVSFCDVDPNVTGHDAYNSDAVDFVLKILEKPASQEG